MYKTGIGCEVKPFKAVSWFQKSAEQGNRNAIYFLGYMYYKGLGVAQSYDQAVQYFLKSNTAMARHWLGVCSYFGYGLPKDNKVAIAYLESNSTINSRDFLEHIKNETALLHEQKVQKALETSQKEAITSTLLENESQETKTTKKVATQDLLGTWTGRFIEYDESGNTILRLLPIEIAFTQDDAGNLQSKIQFNQQVIAGESYFENNHLFVDKYNFTLEKLFTHNKKLPNLDYQVLDFYVQKKTHNSWDYLTANITAYISEWEEIAPPMAVVLRPKNAIAITETEEALLASLVDQKEDFITLYPVPFEDQLHIGFDLTKTSQVSIHITGVHTAATKVIVSDKLIEQGHYTVATDLSDFISGLYVVKVMVDDQVYLKTVIKN